MAAVGLLYVGAVLFINGLALAGLVRGVSMIPMNLFVGILQVITPLYLIFTASGTPLQVQATIVGASGLFLFGFTYLYVAMNNAFNLDGTGLGWFCLFVVFAACVISYWEFTHAGFLGPAGLVRNNAIGHLLGVLWITWAVLWFEFWLILGIGKTGLTAQTGWWCAAQGLYTGLIPALVLLNVPGAVTNTFAIIIGVVSAGTFVLTLVVLRPRWRTEPAPAPAEAAVPTSTAYG